ncbi:hypothetical protein GCM10022243_34360 [Saccharothrix violaceirubra]|uniref:CHAT domain-containing protein n=1 Tax=Saccharothrix violaceirubra TaxID=413306 RepID=A0A7W7T4Q7_9PSEU|nr:CHAT domain-containing protein [Saccharothrix violaceirubra]MBB4966487.1 hypothetical protein [Saccharothrix violaceirubra]
MEPHLATSLFVRLDRGEPVEAIGPVLYEAVLADQEPDDATVFLIRRCLDTLPPDHPWTGSLLHLHSLALVRQEKWAEAVRLAEASLDAPFPVPEFRYGAIIHFSEVHCTLHEAGEEVDLDRVIGTLRALLDQVDEPHCHAIIATRCAYLLAARDTGEDAVDAARMLDAAIPVLPADMPGLDGTFRLSAAIAAELAERTGDPALLDAAVEALDRAIACTGQRVADVEQDHATLALTLIRRWPDERPTDVRDRIVDSLAKAVAAGYDDLWPWYGGELCARGEATASPEDLRVGIRWLDRYLATPEDDGLSRTAIRTNAALAHRALWQSTGDPSHAAAAQNHATVLLGHDISDGERVVMHRIRLDPMVPVSGRDTDPPVLSWIAQARGFVESTDHPDLEAVAALAAIVTFVELAAIASGELAIRLAAGETFESMFGSLLDVVRRAPDEYAEMVTLLSDLYRNYDLVLHGDSDTDHSATLEVLKQHRDDPDWGDERAVVALISTFLGVRIGNLELLDGSLAVHPAAIDLFRALHTDAGFEEISQRTIEARAALGEEQGIFTEFLDYMVAMLGEGPLPENSSPLMRPFRTAVDILDAIRRDDIDAIRAACRRLDVEVATTPRSAVRRHDLAANVRAIAYSTLATFDTEDAHATLTAIMEEGTRWDSAVADRDPGILPTAEKLAWLLRQRGGPGDGERARRVGFEMLFLSWWRVLMQTSDDHALDVARTASANAGQFVSWFLADGALDDLVRLLDASRGLVLGAAALSRTASGKLTALGHADLAARLAAPAADPIATVELRHRVIRVLADADAGLADPPTTDAIREGLRRNDSDALCYLAPRTEHHDGFLLLVPADGPVEVRGLDLPAADDIESAPGRYGIALDGWNRAATTDGPEHGRWRDALAELCAWAGEAVGRTLLTVLGDRTRVVLVPIGTLGLVPWHAACHDGRHLLEDLTLTTVPSARVFLDLVDRPAVTGTPVLVGNPDRRLHAGAHEIALLNRLHYADAVCLGLRPTHRRPTPTFPDGSGTPEQVLARLGEPVSVLHLACHARADMRHPLASSITLSNGELSARTLLGLEPTGTLALGVVALAACETGSTWVDHDEALSLATTFLTIGARSVVGSLWKVPARGTTRLMALFHHFLRTEPPATALRRAQLCLLDPDREPPPAALGLPAGEHDRDPANWAGFVASGR